MKPTVINAFTRDLTSPADAATRRDRAFFRSKLAPMTAEVGELDFGWSLELSPMQAIDALWLWPRLASANSQTLLTGVHQSVWCESKRPLKVREITQRLGLEVVRAVSDDSLILGDEPLQQLLSLVETQSLRAVRVDGPIEDRDARAMLRALDAGRSPLEIELRAAALLAVKRDREVSLQVRTIEPALALVAQNVRHYLAAVLQKPMDSIEAPPTFMLQRLLSITGGLTIRPIETEVLATSVDLGILSEVGRTERPANRGLIYDLPSRTWHDEP